MLLKTYACILTLACMIAMAAWSVAGFVAGVVGLLWGAGEPARMANVSEWGLWILVELGLAGGIVSGLALLQRRRWAYFPAWFATFLLAWAFPIGTTIAVFGAIALLLPSTRAALADHE
jgi:hypothetical protein